MNKILSLWMLIVSLFVLVAFVFPEVSAILAVVLAVAGCMATIGIINQMRDSENVHEMEDYLLHVHL